MKDDDGIKLLGDPDDAADGIYGYFRVSEGRVFLRELYALFVTLAPFGARKIAATVADERPDQRKEDERTRQALGRWLAGQSELWDSDMAKTLRVLRKLEIQMAFEPEVKQLFDDRARSIHRLDFARALASFFYTTSKLPMTTFKIANPLARYEGVYEVFMRQESLTTDDVSFARANAFCRFSRDEEFNFLVFQEFTIVNRGAQGQIFSNRRSGFAFPGHDNVLCRFVINQSKPTERIIDAFNPDATSPRIERYYPLGVTAESSDLQGYYHFFAVDRERPENAPNDKVHLRSYLYRTLDVLYKKVTDDRVRFIDKVFAGIMWEIPL